MPAHLIQDLFLLMLHHYAIDIHGVAQQYELRLSLALSDSTPDLSTARQLIPILLTGKCSAPSQLSNGISYVLMRRVLMELSPVIEV